MVKQFRARQAKVTVTITIAPNAGEYLNTYSHSVRINEIQHPVPITDAQETVLPDPNQGIRSKLN